MGMKQRYRAAYTANQEKEQAARAAVKRLARRLHGDKIASREDQHGRYLDCGPQAWDDRESESGDH